MSDEGPTGGAPSEPPTSTASRDDEALPVLNGRYEIHRRLAKGGMAEVYLGRDQLLDRPVAVKILFPEFSSDPSFVERFRREAQAAANLSHPHVVGVYDWGEHRDTYFIVMEYVEGRSLADIIRREGPLHPDRAAEVATDIAAALSFAHRNGVVHRDIKPGNVLITADGQVKVTDFGIAQALVGDNTGEDDLTTPGMVLGTATYFSPEQAQGRHLDPRSDLYSLGVVLYEMLTSRPPFTADRPVDIAYKHVTERADPPSSRGVEVPSALEAITMKLLAKNPANRYPSAEDVRADLRRYREGEPVMAESVLAPAPAVATIDAGANGDVPKSRVGVYAGVLIVLFALLGGLVFLLVREITGVGGAGEAAIPSVVGENVTEAKDRLEDAGFEVRTQFEENDEFEPNVVFDQDPGGGTRADRGSTVTLLVSSGRNGVDVPSVVGLQIDGARVVLLQAGFQVEVIEEFSNLVPQGEVFRQDPESGQKAPRGSTITITFSKGPEPVEIPDVAGQADLQAAAVLGRLGFNVDRREEPNEQVPPGTVIRTDPAAGQLAVPGTTITLIVSEGLGRVQVPDLTNRGQDEAVAILQGVGLTAAIESVPVPAGSGQAGLVVSQLPGAGTEVDRGAVVAIRIGVAQAPTTTVPESTTTTEPPVTTTTRPTTTTEP